MTQTYADVGSMYADSAWLYRSDHEDDDASRDWYFEELEAAVVVQVPMDSNEAWEAYEQFNKRWQELGGEGESTPGWVRQG